MFQYRSIHSAADKEGSSVPSTTELYASYQSKDANKFKDEQKRKLLDDRTETEQSRD